MTTTRKKLIEVALPLEAINIASAREKSIRHGHPSTLHLWWARRPLAAARAVIFAQMVDDPSAQTEAYPTAAAQEARRQALFELIEQLVQWENTTNETVLERARAEIRQSWAWQCLGANAARLTDAQIAAMLASGELPALPAFHDPFAGGGALPLEAQRLGLESYASDLNPVAVLINKAMIEIPPKFAGKPPVNPAARQDRTLFKKEWRGAAGLADDVRYYGQWMRDEAEKRIGHLYPQIEITAEMVAERPDLKPYQGRKLTVIAWLWARTVKSPNPAFAHVDVPLASTFMLSTKAGKEAYVEPVIEHGGYRFTVKVGKPKDAEAAKNGTKLVRANFVCVMSRSPISGDYIKAEAKAGRMRARMMAIVAEGDRGRVYLSPTEQMEDAARQAQPSWGPEGALVEDARAFTPTLYGLNNWSDLFTGRQLVALTTFSELVQTVSERVHKDALIAGLPEGNRLSDGGVGASAYADAVALYLAFAVDKGANYWSSLCAWHQTRDGIVSTFGRQAVSMVWDFAEANPLSDSSGNFLLGIEQAAKMIANLGLNSVGTSLSADAGTQPVSANKVVSTDPPYYDNVPYADLSDFFYAWLRPTLKSNFPALFDTMAVPKNEELVAFPYRHGSKLEAEVFFLEGMTKAMRQLAEQTHCDFPVTIYYAFKQAETQISGTSSTGWETFLDAVIRSGFAISGTWPVRTEYTSQLKTTRSALASSIVLVCRRRLADAPTASRREFVAALQRELPAALAHLQRSNIAPVDLAQAAIGPGMAIYTRYGRVLDASGHALPVRAALALINETLDMVLAEQEGDFDADTRWALAWFEQFGFHDGEFGVAETLSKAKNTSVSGMVEAGIVAARAGKVQLLRPEQLAAEWDPVSDKRLTVWEMVHHLVRALDAGERAAAALVAGLGSRAETARELAYRLYTICERKKRAQEALAYNALVQSWPEIVRLSKEVGRSQGQERLL